jgi:hypothetical protein
MSTKQKIEEAVDSLLTESVKIGDTVTIPNQLTTDPDNRSGKTGKVVAVDGEDITVSFGENDSSVFDCSIFS